MNNITSVSEITPEDLWEYLNPSDSMTESDSSTLSNLLGVAKAYISDYTGRTLEELDDYQDIVIVALILVQDMWDNRTLYIDKNNVNRVVDSILNMHSVNLLPEESA